MQNQHDGHDGEESDLPSSLPSYMPPSSQGVSIDPSYSYNYRTQSVFLVQYPYLPKIRRNILGYSDDASSFYTLRRHKKLST
ncbi:hypothetical protein KXD40_002419 [Peronospora effusa]|nr:hypothetical protein KXD40_002419 [Peronospora effusa]